MNYHSNCCLKQDQLIFEPVRLEDKAWMDRIIRLEDSNSADWSFANIFVWDESFHQFATQLGDRLLIRLMYHGKPFYAFPIGRGDLVPVIEGLHTDASSHNVSLKIRGITAKNRRELEAAFPGRFDYFEDTYVNDYVYQAEKLSSLAGKKLHSKRNHINRFIENNPSWQFEPITTENLPECMEMNREWVRENEGHSNVSSEVMALERTFEHFAALKLEGGLLRTEGRVIAYTIGEPLNTDTYVVHFEKAFSSIQGAYPMINREFVRHIMKTYPDIQYINREDDMGIDTLQKAKRSYYPDVMVEKYTANWREI